MSDDPIVCLDEARHRALMELIREREAQRMLLRDGDLVPLPTHQVEGESWLAIQRGAKSLAERGIPAIQTSPHGRHWLDSGERRYAWPVEWMSKAELLAQARADNLSWCTGIKVRGRYPYAVEWWNRRMRRRLRR